MASSVMPRPTTCCERPSGTVRMPCSRPKAMPVRSATATPPQSGSAEPDGEPAGEGADHHDALDAEVEHAGPLADQLAHGREDQRRGDAQHRRPEARRDEDVEDSTAQPRRMRKRVSFSAATMVRSAVASRMSAM